jgi:GxxExxY protein
VPVTYKGRALPPDSRADMLLADAAVVTVKAVAALLPAHDAQVLPYLRHSHVKVGLMMNFQAFRLKDGLGRFIM